MDLERDLKLLPNFSNFKPLFKTPQEYQTFVDDFYKEVKPLLDARTEARSESEHASRHHIVY